MALAVLLRKNLLFKIKCLPRIKSLIHLRKRKNAIAKEKTFSILKNFCEFEFFTLNSETQFDSFVLLNFV